MQNWPNQRGKYRSLMMIKACDRSDLSRLELSGGKKRVRELWWTWWFWRIKSGIIISIINAYVRMHMPCSFPRLSAADSNYPKLEACFWPHLCFMEACICTMNFRHARIPRGLKKFEERRSQSCLRGIIKLPACLSACIRSLGTGGEISQKWERAVRRGDR